MFHVGKGGSRKSARESLHARHDRPAQVCVVTLALTLIVPSVVLLFGV